MDSTLILLIMLLHVSCTTTTTIVSTADSSDCDASWARACRRCKFYMKVDSGGAPNMYVDAPPEMPSSGKKTNVGAVVGLTAVLLFMIVGITLWTCLNLRSSTINELAAQPSLVVQPAVVQPVGLQTEAQLLPVTECQAQPSEARRHETEDVMEPNGDDQEARRPVQVEQDGDNDDDVLRPRKPNVGPVQGQGQGEGQGRDKKKGVAGEVEERKQEKVRNHGKIEIRERMDRVEVEKDVGKLEEDVKGKKPKEVDIEEENSLGLPKKYTYKYLRSVTNNFDVENKIGGGGFGTVYRGEFVDGTVVAVKVLKYHGKIDDFKNEVEALGTADHPNLVKLIGYCDDALMRILVYEYMSNGSLDKWIFHATRSRSLSWPEMKNVVQGIARGLEYLHEKCERKILHRDLKPHNVVLDGDNNAKLCDFGLAKLLNKDQSSTSTDVAGTQGYMAPEVLRNKRITDKVDVYSFGIVVLEILFGKRYMYLVNLDQTNSSDVINLPDLIQSMSEDMRKHGKEIKKLGKLAKWCLIEKPEERPTMSVVVAALYALEARFKVAKPRRI